MTEGYIKLHRSLLDNPVVMKDNDHLAVWIWLLCHAVFKEVDVVVEGKRKTLQAGQLVTGRKVIAEELHISESKVQRILKTFEIEQQIEQQTNPRNRVISIVSWDKYQQNEQQNEQQLNNKRTTSEQQVNTKEERKERKERKKLLLRLKNNNDIIDEDLDISAFKEGYNSI